MRDGTRLSMTPKLDGTLESWGSLRTCFSPGALLCGNGLSINVWPGFEYASLFEHATGAGLTELDLELFAETQNFERVLSDLGTAIRVNQILGVDASTVLERYQSVQRGLGNAVREVHVRRSQVGDATLEAIRSELTEYAWIASISYDLLVYWAMARGFKPFVDLFRGGDRLRFDPNATDVFAPGIPVHFPHGAMHLVVNASGDTWKLRGKASNSLLDQFGEPIADDPEARPLLVTEGTSRDKLRAIEGNAYLAHCLTRMREVELPFVVFGASLGEQDRHLLEALNEHPARAVAVSMVRTTVPDLRIRQREIHARLYTDDLRFFDAATHPLGGARLRVVDAETSQTPPTMKSAS
jgi:hypothetical protein